MAWKIAVCDDESFICGQLEEYLNRFAAEQGESFAIRVFLSAEELLGANADFDILLLDIQMGGMSGMNAARELRRRQNHAVIFFITSMTQYAIEGYEVHAYSFLAKPLQYELLKDRLRSALQMLKKSTGTTLQFQAANGLIQVNTNEIYYIESFRHEIQFQCRNFSFVESEITLSGLERKLETLGFSRCHKSYLVNMRNIRLIGESEIQMANDCCVPLSKHRRRDFLSAYARYRKDKL